VNQNVRVNRTRDFMERVGWTSIQIGAGAFLAWATTGDPWSWRTFAYAVAVAVAKVAVAQRVGDTNDGAAIPGGVTDSG
jgi:hypothetical protein